MRRSGMPARLASTLLLVNFAFPQNQVPVGNGPISDRQRNGERPGVADTQVVFAPTKVGQEFLMQAEMRRQQKLREERLRQLAEDSDRLTALANELKQEIRVVSHEPVLPVATIKKAEEIEKLAKKLKQNLRGPS